MTIEPFTIWELAGALVLVMAVGGFVRGFLEAAGRDAGLWWGRRRR